MEAYKINQESFNTTIRKAILEAQDFDWTGWRIPIYLEEDGTVTSGGWLSQGSWQPDAHELPISVERWSMSDRHSDYWDDNQEKEVYDKDHLSFEVEEILEWYTEEIENYKDGQSYAEETKKYEFI